MGDDYETTESETEVEPDEDEEYEQDKFYESLGLSSSDSEELDMTEELEGAVTLDDSNFAEALSDFEFLVINFYHPKW